MKTALLTLLSGALILSGTAHAAKKAPAKKPAKAQPALVCPVMGSKISSVKAASGKSTYKGKTYYFCCGGCKPEFDKNPEKFITKAKPAKKETKAAKPAPKTVAAAAEEELVCPVAKEKIASKAAASGSSEYKGKTYYFCCAGCKPEFDKDPEKFLTKAD